MSKRGKLFGLALLIALATPAVAQLPTPSGKHAIGSGVSTFAGERVLLWYPTPHADSPTPYATASEIEAAEKSSYYEQTPETIRAWSKIAVRAAPGAAVAPGRWPLVVLLPGAGVYALHYTAMATDLASRGFVVAVVDYYGAAAPKRGYSNDDWDAATLRIAETAVKVADAMVFAPAWRKSVRAADWGVAGHSIGGTAALLAPRLDRRFAASVNMDGGIFGRTKEGAVAPALILRSRPVYSDADLAKRGRTRAQMEERGRAAEAEMRAFIKASAKVPVEVLSMRGTGHFSFSDAPFVMPDTILRFGGDILDFHQAHRATTECLAEFFEAQVGGSGQRRSCERFPFVERLGR